MPAGRCSGAPAPGLSCLAAPGSGEDRLPERHARRYRVSARAGVGIGRSNASECRPREGRCDRQGVWFGHVRPIRPNPNPKR